MTNLYVSTTLDSSLRLNILFIGLVGINFISSQSLTGIRVFFCPSSTQRCGFSLAWNAFSHSYWNCCCYFFSSTCASWHRMTLSLILFSCFSAWAEKLSLKRFSSWAFVREILILQFLSFCYLSDLLGRLPSWDWDTI